MTSTPVISTIQIHWNESQREIMFQALVKQPFIEVFEVIRKLQMIRVSEPLEFTRGELKICLNALRGNTEASYWDLLTSIQDVLQNYGLIGDRSV